MKQKWMISIWLLLIASLPAMAYGLDDLFLRKKSDSAIKPLVFPLSMAVIENRPLKGHYYFYEGGLKKFDEGLEGNPDSGEDKYSSAFSDAKIIKKTLLKTDPARITPSERGEDVLGLISRSKLKEIGKTISKDMIFVFRREIRVNATSPLPQSLFQYPDEFFTYQGQPYSVKIKTQGLVYLSKQNKILAIPANEKSKSFDNKGEQSTGEKLRADWSQLAREGLKDLAAAAKKAILDKKFEVRRPSY